MVDGAVMEGQTQNSSDGSPAVIPREPVSRHRRRWPCPQCDHAFKKREHLVRHVRSHTKEKPYACDVCRKRYGRRDTLIRHARTHGQLGGHNLTAQATIQAAIVQGTDEVAAVGQRSPVQPLPINDDGLSSNASLDERPCFEDSSGSLAHNLGSHDLGVAPGENAELGSNLFSSIYYNTHTQADFLSIEELFDDTGGWPDLDLLMFQDVIHEPSRLVRESVDNNGVASCASAAGSPREHARATADLTQSQANEDSSGDNSTEIPDNNIRDIVRDQWHTRPAREGAHPYVPTQLKGQDQVDEAYRAGLLYRLRPCLHDDVLPSADFLNRCIKLYFAKFQPIFPIIHAPSFRPSSENALLLLSICSIGALFMGTASAATYGRKIFAKLNKAVLASWEVYLYRGGHEALAVAQAVALGQTFGMLSRNSNDLLMTESFHGTIISWARQTGMFQVKSFPQPIDPTSIDDLEMAWMSWSRAEETIRFLLALHIHDYQFAAIFHHEPILRHETRRLPRCSPDELFVASTAARWHTKIKSLRSSSTFGKSNDDEFPDWLTIPKFHASLNAYAVLAGHGAAICKARYTNINEDTIADFRCRLINWYETYSPTMCHPDRDPHCVMVLWHEAFMLLYVSFDWIERVVGREGSSMTPEDMAHIQSWVAGLQGQSCAMHAVLIHKRLQALPISTEPAIHVPKALFYAGLVIYCYVKFRSVEAPQVEVDILELRWGDSDGLSGRTEDLEPPGASLQQLDSTTLYSIADLLHRQGHWELSRKFASILELLIDDLTDS